MLCSSCGTENQENSKFCQNCGNSLEVQSSIFKVDKLGKGEKKAMGFDSREERFRKAKLAALKAIKDLENEESKTKNNVVFMGEKIF